MKTMLKVTFLFALVAFANTLFAAGNLKVNMLPVNAGKAVVTISTITDSNFNITIADEKGHIIYYQENANLGENYSKVYDFSNLEDGTYQLSAVSNNLTAEREFNKSHGKIIVGEEKTTLEPFFGYEAGILKCSYLNFTKEDMTLLFYKNNELIYTKNVGRGFNMQEALNLSKLDKGNYEAVLYASGKQFKYPIQIQ
jgi:hypothetical protein